MGHGEWSRSWGGGLTPHRPAWLISRSTRLRPTRMSAPSRRSAHTRGDPYVSRERLWIDQASEEGQMEVIPAVDVLGGRVVRLLGGDYSRVIDYGATR